MGRTFVVRFALASAVRVCERGHTVAVVAAEEKVEVLRTEKFEKCFHVTDLFLPARWYDRSLELRENVPKFLDGCPAKKSKKNFGKSEKKILENLEKKIWKIWKKMSGKFSEKNLCQEEFVEAVDKFSRSFIKRGQFRSAFLNLRQKSARTIWRKCERG